MTDKQKAFHELRRATSEALTAYLRENKISLDTNVYRAITSAVRNVLFRGHNVDLACKVSALMYSVKGSDLEIKPYVTIVCQELIKDPSYRWQYFKINESYVRGIPHENHEADRG